MDIPSLLGAPPTPVNWIEIGIDIFWILIVGSFAIYWISRLDLERRQAEERLEHLNLVLRAIRTVNQLITREKDRDRLLKGACDDLIATRGYYSTWTAVLNESGGLVTTAEAGLGKEFLPMVEWLKRGELTDCGRRALMQSDVVVTEDPALTCVGCPLAANCGGRGAMTVRLKYDEKVYGLLTVSIPAALTADEEEQSLFKEVAGDIAFALHNIELEEKRQRAEEALRGSEEKLRLMFESVTDGITVTDLNGVITGANERTAEIHGFSSKDELLGKSAFGLIGQRDHEKAAMNMQKTLEQGPVMGIEYTLVKADGSEFPGELSGSVIKDAPGNPIGFIAITRDITERKRTEEALRHAAEEWRTTFDSITDLVSIHDKDFKLVRVNKAFADVFKMEPKELIGKTCYKVVHGTNEPVPNCPHKKNNGDQKAGYGGIL